MNRASYVLFARQTDGETIDIGLVSLEPNNPDNYSFEILGNQSLAQHQLEHLSDRAQGEMTLIHGGHILTSSDFKKIRENLEGEIVDYSSLASKTIIEQSYKGVEHLTKGLGLTLTGNVSMIVARQYPQGLMPHKAIPMLYFVGNAYDFLFRETTIHNMTKPKPKTTPRAKANSLEIIREDAPDLNQSIASLTRPTKRF